MPLSSVVYHLLLNLTLSLIAVVVFPADAQKKPVCDSLYTFPLLFRKREKFIIRQPPIGGKDDYDSESSWISNGLPSNSRRRRRGDGRGRGGEWREK